MDKQENMEMMKALAFPMEKLTFWGTRVHLARTAAYIVKKQMNYEKT